MAVLWPCWTGCLPRIPLFVLEGVVYERCVPVGNVAVSGKSAPLLWVIAAYLIFFATDSKNSATLLRNSAALFGTSAALSQRNSPKMGSNHFGRRQPIGKICCEVLLLIMSIPDNFGKISAGIPCITYGFSRICLAVKLFQVTFAYIARRMAACGCAFIV